MWMSRHQTGGQNSSKKIIMTHIDLAVTAEYATKQEATDKVTYIGPDNERRAGNNNNNNKRKGGVGIRESQKDL
jgi:hypothetical protein